MSIPREQLIEIFWGADENGDRLVSPAEIIRTYDSIQDDGGHINLWESLLGGGDLDKDRRLSLDEFLTYMEQKQA